MGVERALCTSKSGGSLTWCGRVRAFGEVIARDLKHARAIEATGRKLCAPCLSQQGVDKARREGVR